MASDCWRNCDLEDTDAEIGQIDALEELLEGEDRDSALTVRRLITGFEVCHHNSLRWAERIAHAIADGAIPAPSGRKRSEHPVTVAHLSLRRLLESIADGATDTCHHGEIPAMDAANLAQRLGVLRDRERWLAGLVLDNLEHHLHDANLIPVIGTADNRMFPGGALNVESEDEARAYFCDSFGHYLSYRNADILMVDDLHPCGRENRLPLLLVIQFANPCSVNYFQYVSLLLEMVSGRGAEVPPTVPFRFCGHCSATQRDELGRYVRACQSFLGRNHTGDFDEGLFGEPDDRDRAKNWLVASFGKTLRLQLGE
jgi:hypothetical protein